MSSEICVVIGEREQLLENVQARLATQDSPRGAPCAGAAVDWTAPTTSSVDSCFHQQIEKKTLGATFLAASHAVRRIRFISAALPRRQA